MAGIYAGLAPEKEPMSNQSIDWTDTSTSRATLIVKGGSLGDLDNRSKVNQVLRSYEADRPEAVQVLDPGSRATVSFTGRVLDPMQFESAHSELILKLESLGTELAKSEEEFARFQISQGWDGSSALADIQRGQILEKSIKDVRTKIEKHRPALNAMWACARSAEKLLGSLKEEEGQPRQGLVYRMPVLTSARPRVDIHHKCRYGVPKDVIPWLLKFWQANRIAAPNLLQYPSAAVVGAGGIPIPMADEKATLLSQWMRGKSTSRPFELISHYWYIVSWNRANPKKPVLMPKGCRNPYSRSGTTGDPRQKERKAEHTQRMAEEVRSLRQVVEKLVGAQEEQRRPPSSSAKDDVGLKLELPQNMRQWLASGPLKDVGPVQPDGADSLVFPVSVRDKPVFAVLQEASAQFQELRESRSRIVRLEEILDEMEAELQAHQLSKEEKVASPLSGQPEPDEKPDGPPSEVGDPPEVFFDGPFTWFRDPSNISGQMKCQSFWGVDYFRTYTKEKPDLPKSEPVKPVKSSRASPPSEKKEVPTGTPIGVPVGKAKGESSPKGKDPLTQENPLRAKGVPRSQGLSQEQKDRLRKKLEIPNPDPLDPKEWASLTPAARTAYRKATSLPHWATTAVLKNAENLVLIETGILTSKNPTAGLPSESPRGKSGHQVKGASDAWTALKAAFPGVGLFTNPSTKKEKSLKSGYDSLLSEYGRLPCFPKPKAKSRGVGGTAGQVGLNPGGLDSSIFQMVGLIGKLVKAFQG
jgi:hypothetical protein